MLYWSLQIIITSIIIILLIHHLINFFKDTLTVPKIKDLVNVPVKKYEDIFHIIDSKQEYNHEIEEIHTKINTQFNTNIKPDVNDMKNELKTFLKSQMNNNESFESPIEEFNTSTTFISQLNSSYI
jgi:phage terminase large subunit-like protein